MFWTQLLIIAALTAVSLIIFYFIRTAVLEKYKINKNYLLLFLIFLFVLPMFFQKQYALHPFLQYIHVLLVSLTFLVYMEIVRIKKIEKNKPVIGKPKAKPSRIKNKD